MIRIFLSIVSFLLIISGITPLSQAKTYQYSEKDIKMIARVVYGESRSQPFLGKAAVSLVVINRHESGRYGKTIRCVIFAKNQFYVAKKTDQTCIRAVHWAIKNRVLPKNTYYFRRSKSKNWHHRQYYCRIGSHSFYTSGKAKDVTGPLYIDRRGKLKERETGRNIYMIPNSVVS
jgi:spore germination cell wall hydrolase CwlJ-like protein